MKVLITGSEGFVGRHVDMALAGHDITRVDLRLGTDVREFCRTDETRFDLVVHLAAIVGGRQMIEHDPLAVATDLSIDAEFFRWAEKTRPRRVVYYSSSAAYPVWLQTGDPYQLREPDIDLEAVAIGRPDMTYGWAKLTGELLASFLEAEGVRVHVFRPFSGYGEDQDQDYPFPAFVARARAREDPFTVWGDGTQVRDWIHVDDVVGATLEAIREDVPGPVNLCTGRATSFVELADLMCREAGYSATLAHLEDRPRGVAYRVGDPSRMLSFYTPKVELEDGIARALR